MSIEKSLYNLKIKILKCDEIPHYLQEGIANDIHFIEESVRAKNNESLHLVSACYRCGYDEAILVCSDCENELKEENKNEH